MRIEMNQDFRRVFHGLELTARKRMSNKWMLNGSLTLNSATYNAPPEGYQDTIAGDIFGVAALPMDPTNREFIEGEQTLINGTRWIAKLSGLYELPWGINLAGTLNAREGFPFIPNILSPNRPNGLGTIRVMVEPYAASRYGNLALVDMKAEKKITIDKLSINASVDVFNLFNSNTVLNRVTTQNSATANRVTEVTGPRVLRFGSEVYVLRRVEIVWRATAFSRRCTAGAEAPALRTSVARFMLSEVKPCSLSSYLRRCCQSPNRQDHRHCRRSAHWGAARRCPRESSIHRPAGVLRCGRQVRNQ